MEQNKEIIALIEGIEVGKVNTEWFITIQRNNTFVLLNDIENFINALPLLNSPELSVLINRNFPLSDLLTVALTSNSEYWVDKALNQISFFKLSGFRKELNDVEHDKSFSQRIRHLAKKLKYQSAHND